MKAILSFLAFFFAASMGFARLPAGYTKIQPERVDAYKAAIQTALNHNPYVYSNCNPNWLSTVLRDSDEILVNTMNGQPLLMVDAYYGPTQEDMQRMVITTEADLKTIKQVVAEQYRMGEMNTGDLANPVIVEDYVLQTRRDCRAANAPQQ